MKERRDEGTEGRRNRGMKERRDEGTLTNLTIFNDWRISEIRDLLMKTLSLKQTN